MGGLLPEDLCLNILPSRVVCVEGPCRNFLASMYVLEVEVPLWQGMHMGARPCPKDVSTGDRTRHSVWDTGKGAIAARHAAAACRRFLILITC